MALNNQDKISIVEQHIRNLEVNKFNIELSIAEENSVESPSESILHGLNGQLANVIAKISTLNTELTTLQQAGQ
jgi:hypothetical protein